MLREYPRFDSGSCPPRNVGQLAGHLFWEQDIGSSSLPDPTCKVRQAPEINGKATGPSDLTTIVWHEMMVVVGASTGNGQTSVRK